MNDTASDSPNAESIDELLIAAGIPETRKPGDPTHAQIRYLAWLWNRVDRADTEPSVAAKLREAWCAGEGEVQRLIAGETPST